MRFFRGALTLGLLLALAVPALASPPDCPPGQAANDRCGPVDEPSQEPSEEPTVTPTEEPTVTPTEEPTTPIDESTEESSAEPAAADAEYPPPSTETSSGKFIVKCEPSHLARVDPIVNPGPEGTQSGHLHQFFGNRSTDSDSTHKSMTAAETSCVLGADTAAYWVPALLDPDGNVVEPRHMFAYYRNRPVGYGTTVPFPPDFRFITGGVGAEPGEVFWNCHDDDSSTVQHDRPPLCTGSDLKMNVMFPNCWDGVNLDSPDHRSHVIQPNGNGSTACPESHPVKLPDVRFFIHFPRGTGGPGYRLSDGQTIPHVDFWNTWQQPGLEQLVRDCLNTGTECGKVSG